MRILYLDVASHNGLIAAVTPGAVLAPAAVDHRVTDRELMPLMERVLHDAQWKHEDVTHIACVTGPGGFTSLRVGVGAANALAWALSVPSCGIHLSDLYFFRASTAAGVHEPQLRDVVWLHSTKKSSLFLRGFGVYAALASDSPLVNIDDALSMIPSDAHIAGELIPEHHSAFAARGQYLMTLPSVDAVLPSFLAQQQYEEISLIPWYGRGI